MLYTIPDSSVHAVISLYYVTEVRWVPGHRVFWSNKINMFQFKNWIRAALKKPLLKPKRGSSHWRHAMVQIGVDGGTKYIHTKSNQEAQRIHAEIIDLLKKLPVCHCNSVKK
jgi:hypothetical protein